MNQFCRGREDSRRIRSVVDTAPQRKVPGDRVEFPLPMRGDTWEFPDRNFISLRSDLDRGDFEVRIGGSQQIERPFEGLKLSPSDTFRLVLRSRRSSDRTGSSRFRTATTHRP
ncbi:MAG: hypothetical protein CMJ67_03195 [Planctomycetaceae bacterium]|nr:hypothetical protein [Planctomycetaceae bacterium]